MIRRPPRSTHCISSAASDVYKRQIIICTTWCAHRYISRVRSAQVLIFYVPGSGYYHGRSCPICTRCFHRCSARIPTIPSIVGSALKSPAQGFPPCISSKCRPWRSTPRSATANAAKCFGGCCRSHSVLCCRGLQLLCLAPRITAKAEAFPRLDRGCRPDGLSHCRADPTALVFRATA